MYQEKTDTKPTFDGLGIASSLLDALKKQRFLHPTPIQHKGIPVALQGKDMIGIAQTGTGKTLAFGIPMMQRLSQIKKQGLILAPTRELALQINASLEAIGRLFGLRTAVLIGGQSINIQHQALRRKPHVIVATPGRLLDHMEQRTVDLRAVGILVLDEADRMLDMGFAPQIKRILQAVPQERQTLLFSATMPQAIASIANTHMRLPVTVEIARAGSAAKDVTQELIFVKKEDKTRLLEWVLFQYKGSILVFSRTKHGAKRITRAVKAMGHASAEIHANRSLAQRREALDGFKDGRYRVLLATDIAARGIDVQGIELVVNFDLPDQTEDYVHRIGRTGRAGRSGHAISFATHDQQRDVRMIERLIGKPLPVAMLPELPAARALPPDLYEERFVPQRGRASASRGSAQRRFGARIPREERKHW